METQALEKSQRINLGSGPLNLSEVTARRFNFFAAFFFIGLSILVIYNLFNKENSNFADKSMPFAYMMIGLVYLFKASVAQSKTSMHAPHFLLTEKGIKIKVGVLKKSQFIEWNDIQKIELGNYKIGFKIKSETQFYPYQTRKETSIVLKKAIKTKANELGIEVENLLRK